MKRIVMSYFALALVMIPAYAQVTSQSPAQSNCTLTVRGLRLGMNLQELLALFPSSSKRKEMRDAIERAKATTNNETVYLAFDPANDGSSEQFSGVDSVLAGVYKGQVVDFTVSYVGPTWRTVNEWIDKLAASFGLPNAQGWEFDSQNENPGKILRCKGVVIEAGIQGGGGSIRIRNTEYNKAIDNQKEAGEEKKRRDFKP